MDDELKQIKDDLIFQLGTIGHIDWDYFIETAERAKEIQEEEESEFLEDE